MYFIPARFLFLLYPLFGLLGGEATTYASSSPECSLPGLCRDFLLDEYSSASLDNCILFGRSTPGATWISFNRDLQACWALQACDQLDASVPNYVSSEANCTICSATGFCQSALLNSYPAQSAADCLGLCEVEEGCAWYSFHVESRVCGLFNSCPDLLVDGHEGWVSGEEGCSAASTPTPSPSAPSTTPAPTSSTQAPADAQEIVWIASDGATRLGKLFSLLFLKNTRNYW